jgi:hypothetical protein
MRKKSILLTLTCMVLAIAIVACSKDSKKHSNPSLPEHPADYGFAVQGATFVAETLPAPTLEFTPEVNMNHNYISGGANYVTVKSEVEASKVIVANAGKEGYYEVPATSFLTKDIVYDFIMVFDQEFTDASLNVIVAIIDKNGEISEYYTTTITLVEAGAGTLQVSLTFNNDKDIDLHLIEPHGALFSEKHIGFNNRESANGGELDLDSNAACDIDGVNNENITYSAEDYIEPGKYTVYVDMYQNCDPSIATNFVLTIFYEGKLLQTVEGRNPITGTFPVNEPSNTCDLQSIRPVCHFVIPDNGQQPPAKSLKKGLPKFLRSQDK